MNMGIRGAAPMIAPSGGVNMGIRGAAPMIAPSGGVNTQRAKPVVHA